MLTDLLEEFRLDWELSGKALRTVQLYLRDLHRFLGEVSEPTVNDAKTWLASTDSLTVRRKRGQALRAFASWCCDNDVSGLEWACHLPLAVEPVRPQQTVTEADYRAALAAVTTVRDRAVIELLWSSGLRRNELASLTIEDVDLGGGFVVVRTSKTGKPRVAPLSATAVLAVRRLIRDRHSGSLLGLSGNAIRLLLQRLGAPSAHAWRRGWAAEALRRGVSEASLRAAAGWSSGAMVTRYVQAYSEELALAEFRRARLS